MPKTKPNQPFETFAELFGAIVKDIEANNDFEKLKETLSPDYLRDKTRRNFLIELLNRREQRLEGQLRTSLEPDVLYKKVQNAESDEKNTLNTHNKTVKSSLSFIIKFDRTKAWVNAIEQGIKQLDKVSGEQSIENKSPQKFSYKWKLTSVNIDQLLKRAKRIYGPMAGFDIDDQYSPENDLYIQDLLHFSRSCNIPMDAYYTKLLENFN